MLTEVAGYAFVLVRLLGISGYPKCENQPDSHLYALVLCWSWHVVFCLLASKDSVVLLEAFCDIRLRDIRANCAYNLDARKN